MKSFTRICTSLLAIFALLLMSLAAQAQTVTATLEGRVSDATGAVLSKAAVKAVNKSTGFTRTATTSDTGDYQIALLPVGTYTVTAEQKGFKTHSRQVTLQIGANAAVDFALTVGEVQEQVLVQATSEAVEPTRTMVSSVIDEQQIKSLPVNGRQFIDFALLAPGVAIGDTTSGSTDVIIEPVTKLSFASQNIHYNFIAVDGADNISTASGVQRVTPSQEAVREFRVINSTYSTEAGRAVGGIVNIITKSGTNNWHGSAYEYFRNDVMDARSILASPDPATCNVPGDVSSGGCSLLTKLRQNQFGFTLGGPIRRDKTFLFANYEGQRRRESPFYNSVINTNITLINDRKCTLFGTIACGAPGALPIENLNVTRIQDYNDFFIKLDHSFNDRHYLFLRYFFHDQTALNTSPLNDGFDLPSGFKDNAFRDQSIVGNLTSTLRPNLVNELRAQYAHRFFDFRTVSTQPHLEVSNVFTMGVNRGNPDFYEEGRFEIVDSVTWNKGKHTVSFGGDFNFVTTTESFPLFYPFEADFGCLLAVQCGNSFEAGAPFVIFFQRNDAASNFTEPTVLPSGPAIYQGRQIPDSIRNLAKGNLHHTYDGFYIQDKWRATNKLTVNFGLRYEFETWPSAALNNDMNNFDPRFGFAYSLGTSKNIVLRGGMGLFHGTIPSPLLMCQIPSCGGLGQFPGREAKEDTLNAHTRLFAFASAPFITNLALTGGGGFLPDSLLTTGTYPDASVTPGFLGCAGDVLSGCGFFGDAVIVRFAKDHQAPRGGQGSLSLEFEPFKDASMSFTYLRVRGLQLGSFWNVNQPDPNLDPAFANYLFHDSKGNTGTKNRFYNTCFDPPVCSASIPGVRDFLTPYAVYFEADSKWQSTYDGLLIHFNKRMSHHFAMGASYTWSKGIDNGPNPSFVLIPQDNTSPGFRQERAVSADYAKHRFVANSTIVGPKKVNFLVNDFEFGLLLTLESPHYFTKFAGFDANGDVFGNNDRVGIEARNTFRGDSYQSFDMRISRMFNLGEKVKLQALAEGFNMTNTVNVRFFNTAYGAADFCPVAGPAFCGPGPYFQEGSPNPNYGTPRAVNNPRQFQLALKLSF
ncbi:MAG: TonB-dependent receptor [Acidobacteriota bacterium]|nr:TonB-dependent receptor [Acidobacteriota bacterium]